MKVYDEKWSNGYSVGVESSDFYPASAEVVFCAGSKKEAYAKAAKELRRLAETCERRSRDKAD